jgi:hypothetical protein
MLYQLSYNTVIFLTLTIGWKKNFYGFFFGA